MTWLGSARLGPARLGTQPLANVHDTSAHSLAAKKKKQKTSCSHLSCRNMYSIAYCFGWLCDKGRAYNIITEMSAIPRWKSGYV